MSEQAKKQQRIYDLLNIETKPNFFPLPYTKQRKIFYRKKAFKGKLGVEEWNKKCKEGFLTALATVIKKETTTLIRKHAN